MAPISALLLAPYSALFTSLIVILLIVGCFLYTLARNMSAVQLAYAGVALVGISATFFCLKRKREVDARAAEVAARQERANELLSRFGSEIAERIMNGELWEGATSEMVVAMLGSPVEVDERILKTKTKRIYKYFPTGQNRFALRITLDDGTVVKWTDKRVS